MIQVSQMFLIRPPTDAEIRRVLESQRHAGCSYPNPGFTRDSAAVNEASGYQVNRATFDLGRGVGAFLSAKQAVREWRMFDIGWARLFWPDAPIAPESTVALLVRHFGFWSLNVCRIVYLIDEERRYGFAYGTLPEHAETGEERFLIYWREDDSVWYEVLALSRERHPLPRLAYPLSRGLQARFRRDSGAAMQGAVHANR